MNASSALVVYFTDPSRHEDSKQRYTARDTLKSDYSALS